MFKALIAVASVLIATAAVPASAHDWYDDDDSNGYGGYYGYGGYDDYGGDYYDRIIAEHARVCREHERFKETLKDVHEQEQYAGESGYSADLALNEADEEYLERHPEARSCNDWFGQYFGDYGGYDRY